MAFRRAVAVRVVGNAHLRVPAHPLIERVVVSDKFDAADDWIAETAGPGVVVVTADILLAGRCLSAGAAVIGPTGKPSRAISSAIWASMKVAAAARRMKRRRLRSASS